MPILEGVGKLLPWGEFWLLTYDGCRHDQYIPRNAWNYADEEIRAEVLRHYAECTYCSHNGRIPSPLR